MGSEVELCWAQSADTGGRSDQHYNVYVSSNGSSTFVKHNSAGITGLCYTVTGLDLSTSYLIVVVAANGATNDPDSFTDLSVVQDRFILFFVATGGEVMVTRLFIVQTRLLFCPTSPACYLPHSYTYILY